MTSGETRWVSIKLSCGCPNSMDPVPRLILFKSPTIRRVDAGAVITIQQRNVHSVYAPKQTVTKICFRSHHYWYLTTYLLHTATISSFVSYAFSSETGFITKQSRTKPDIFSYSVTSCRCLKKFHNANGYVDY